MDRVELARFLALDFLFLGADSTEQLSRREILLLDLLRFGFGAETASDELQEYFRFFARLFDAFFAAALRFGFGVEAAPDEQENSSFNRLFETARRALRFGFGVEAAPDEQEISYFARFFGAARLFDAFLAATLRFAALRFGLLSQFAIELRVSRSDFLVTELRKLYLCPPSIRFDIFITGSFLACSAIST